MKGLISVMIKTSENQDSKSDKGGLKQVEQVQSMANATFGLNVIIKAAKHWLLLIN